MLVEARDRIFDIEIDGAASLRLCIRRGGLKNRSYQWKLEQISKPGDVNGNESDESNESFPPESYTESTNTRTRAPAPAHGTTQEILVNTHQTHSLADTPRHKAADCTATESWSHIHGDRFCSICWPPTDPAAVWREPS